MKARPPVTAARVARVTLGLGGIVLLVALVSLSFGALPTAVGQVARALVGAPVDSAVRSVVLGARLPRILLALAVGAGLSTAGATFQVVLRNPLADPYVLGISSGAAVGALLSILLRGGGFSGPSLITPVAAALGALVVVAIVYTVGRRARTLDVHALLLAGVVIGAFCTAVVFVLQSLAGESLRQALLWLTGTLTLAGLREIAVVGPVIVACAVGLWTQARALNMMSTGEEGAAQLGVDVERVRKIAYLLASILTGATVALGGVIGFVGLVVPHLCRWLWGPDHRLLLPAAFLTGAAALVLADLVARLVLAPAELPVGAVTALLGAPWFLYLLRRRS